jgi:16S rRNA (adenine1518-N6/adenine1519-N6)-dimethyltransferase
VSRSRTELPRPSRALSAAPSLAAPGFRPSRSKGQNFLTSGAIADRIIRAAALGAGDEVIEIGPGLGILSERILACDVRRLVLVELDCALATRLESLFGADARVHVVQSDFLAVDLPALVERPPVKVVGNLPFNAAGAIFRRLCDHHRLVATMVLMFQREVGERLRAAAGTRRYAALSVFAALYFDIDLHFRVAAGSFHPKPKVDAEVLRFRPRARPAFAPHEEASILEAVRASFSAPRKTIRNSLAHASGIDPRRVVEILRLAGIDPGARAGSLSVADFVSLARALEKVPRPGGAGEG